MSRLSQAVVLARLRRELWHRARTPPEVRLRRLVEHAATRSPRYAGLTPAPLAELPVLTKEELRERFDEIVTDRALRRADVEAFVRSTPGGGRFLRRYRVATSSGSTGQPSVLVFDPDEWVGLLAASVAMRRLAGPPPGPRSAKIGSLSPWHLSSQVGATLQDPRKPRLALRVDQPLGELVEALDRFRPDIVTAPPSILRMLAEAWLQTSPGQVFAGGEVLTDATRRLVADAWGTEPFDQYVTTEAGGVAGECTAHAGLHVVGDHVLVEVVDDRHRPVPAGTFGTSVLVTVLSSRTVPLIRYELADSTCLLADPCPCGRPGPRLGGIAGRARDILRLPGASGRVSVHPTVLTGVLDAAPVSAWQVGQRGDRIDVTVVDPRDGFDLAELAGAVRAALDGAGVVGAPVDVAVVDRIPRPASGKASLFVVEP